MFLSGLNIQLGLNEYFEHALSNLLGVTLLVRNKLKYIFINVAVNIIDDDEYGFWNVTPYNRVEV
jgi:hypothetical protein